MTNAEAVNWLINLTADIGKIEHQELWHYEQALSEIREMLENMPTIEPHRWTPVSSESMPEDGVTVWVTIKGHDVIRCEDGETLEQAVARISKMRRVSEGFWCDDDKTWYNAGGYPMMVQPIAWMPIDTPEPWQGGQE
jgi:hypothetical protein